MNYRECLEYIHSINWCFCRPGLERISELCRAMGDPQKKLKFVHVAGTNGKGSFCAMLSSVLACQGYKVGTYTSPYIRTFNERMSINGQSISNEELIELTESIKPIAEKMKDKPTEFELITALAFRYFYNNNCDIVVLEAGMGGRLDSTNIIEDSLLSVITGIALDHTEYLGDTIEKIAAEKAGIIKEGCPVLYGGGDETAESVIRFAAQSKRSDFFVADNAPVALSRFSLEGSVFDTREMQNVEISLLGSYQIKNALTVIRAVEILRKGGLEIDETSLRKGLKNAAWQGRFEVIARSPLIIFDGAHNLQGISVAVESIKQYFVGKRLYLVSGVLKDKDHAGIAERLSDVISKAYTITPDSPRALPARDYAEELRQFGIDAQSSASVEEALQRASEIAKADGTPLVCLGSLYTYAQIKDWVEKNT